MSGGAHDWADSNYWDNSDAESDAGNNRRQSARLAAQARASRSDPPRQRPRHLRRGAAAGAFRAADGAAGRERRGAPFPRHIQFPPEPLAPPVRAAAAAAAPAAAAAAALAAAAAPAAAAAAAPAPAAMAAPAPALAAITAAIRRFGDEQRRVALLDPAGAAYAAYVQVAQTEGSRLLAGAPQGATLEVPPGSLQAFVSAIDWVEQIVRLLDANNLCHWQQDKRVIAWLQRVVTGPAAPHFAPILRVEEGTPSAGPAEQSVVYRVLQRFTALYNIAGLSLDVQKAQSRLHWDPKKSVTEHQAVFDAFFHMQQQAALATRGAPVTQRVTAFADWPAQYAFLQTLLPQWAMKVVNENPDAFDTAADAWAILRRCEPKRSGGLHALHGDDIPADLASSKADLAGYFEAHPDEAAAIMEHVTSEYNSGSLAAVMARVLGGHCWRCGGQGHNRRDCPQPPSEAERNNEHISAWRVRPKPPRSSSDATTVAALAQQVEALDIIVRQQAAAAKRQESLLAALAAPSSAASAASTSSTSPFPSPTAIFPGASAVAFGGVPPPSALPSPIVAAMPAVAAMPPSSSSSPPPMLVGPDPVPGYVQVGLNPDSGQPIWLLGSLVAASLPTPASSGNE